MSARVNIECCLTNTYLSIVSAPHPFCIELDQFSRSPEVGGGATFTFSLSRSPPSLADRLIPIRPYQLHWAHSWEIGTTVRWLYTFILTCWPIKWQYTADSLQPQQWSVVTMARCISLRDGCINSDALYPHKGTKFTNSLHACVWNQDC